MVKIKPMKKNIGGIILIAAAIAFSFVLVIFGVAVLFSKDIKDNIEEIKEIMTKGQGIEIFIGLFFQETEPPMSPVGVVTSFGFAPSLLFMAYIPIAIGGIFLVIFAGILAFCVKGFYTDVKPSTKKTFTPVKVYSALIGCAAALFVISLFVVSSAILSAYPFLSKSIVEIKKGGFGIKTLDISNDLQVDKSYSIYWLSGSGKNKMMSALLPLVPFIVLYLALILGLIMGSLSWKWVNLQVLAGLGDYDAVNAVKTKWKDAMFVAKSSENVIITNNVQEKDNKKLKKEDKKKNKEAVKQSNDLDELNDDDESQKNTIDNEVVNSVEFDKTNGNETQVEEVVDPFAQQSAPVQNVDMQLKNRCLSFFKNTLDLMNKNNNTQNVYYQKFQETYKTLSSTGLDDKLVQVQKGITDFMEYATSVDNQFVEFIINILKTNWQSFGQTANEVAEMIKRYRAAVEGWNLLEAEVAIQRIMKISLAQTELLPKVGYSLKYRLSNLYKNLDMQLSGIRRLDYYRENRDYAGYRDSCEKIINGMAPTVGQPAGNAFGW